MAKIDLDEVAELLEREAVHYLEGVSDEWLPRMLWCDRWNNRIFMRCTLKEDCPKTVKTRLNALRRRIQKKFGVPVTGVCYRGIVLSWEEAAELTVELYLRHGGDLD